MSLVIEQSKKFDATLESYHLLKYRNYRKKAKLVMSGKQETVHKKVQRSRKKTQKDYYYYYAVDSYSLTKKPKKKRKLYLARWMGNLLSS